MATKVLTYEGLQELVSKLKALIGTKADSSAIPTKVSQLTNDSGYKTVDTNTTYGLSISDHTVSLVEGGSTKSVTVPDNNTTYNDVSASGSESGLMTVDDKKKLDGIATGANKITVDSSLSSTSANPVQNKVIQSALGGKVDTISGKGLSTNDYTDADKEKLTAIASDGEANKINSISRNGTALTIDANKNVNITVPTKTSEITNDSNFVADSSYIHTDNNFTSDLKTKLEGIDTGATKITVDSALSSTSTNPVQNKAVNTALGNKVDKVSGKGLSTNDLTDALVSKINGAVQTSSVGSANGVASLDANGMIPSSQLPSFVDDVIEGYLYNSNFYKESAHTTKITGETGKIYVDLSNEKTYRWSGTAFVEISSSLALGETSSTAYRGDRGKAAYDHSLLTSGNPHNVTKGDIGLSNVENKSSATIRGELTSSDVTDALGFTPQASASGKGLSTNDYTTTEKNKLAGIASGAEVNVQSDWSVTDSSSDAFIKNKPSIPTKTSDLTNDSDFVADASYVHTDVNFTSALKTKLDGIATGANKTTVDSALSSTSTNPVQNKVIQSALAGKVDTVSGKGLSTNDFTDALKSQLESSVTTVDTALSSSSTNPVQNKVINTALSNKVDKVSGKGLSTNDYTADDKTAVDSIASDINPKLTATNIAYGTSSTAAGTATKVVTLTGNTKWALQTGAIIVVKFSNTNTANNPKLNVNSSGAKSVWYDSAVISTASLEYAGYSNRPSIYMYDGTNWVWLGWSYEKDTDTKYSNWSLGQTSALCTSTSSPYSVINPSFVLSTGGVVSIYFMNDVVADAQLNVGGTGAKDIYYKNAKITDGIIKAGDRATFIYNVQYELIAIDRSAEAQANVIETVKKNGTALTVSNKAVDITVPTKTSELTNNSNFVVDANYVHTDVNFTSTLKSKLDGIAAGAQVNTITGVKGNSESSYRTGNVNITKANIGLGNVDNTADANKNVATAVSATNDSANQQITTTYIKSISASGNELTVTKGDSTTSTVSLPKDTDVINKYLTNRSGKYITDRNGNKITVRNTVGTLATSTTHGLMSYEDYNRVRTNSSNITSLQNTKAPLASPEFTGTPTAPTATEGTSTKQIASTEFVMTALASAVSGKFEIQTYTGNGNFGSSNPSSVTFSFAPRIILLLTIYDGGHYVGYSNSYFYNTSEYLGVYRSDMTYDDFLTSSSGFNSNVKRFKWQMKNMCVIVDGWTTTYTRHHWLYSTQLVLTSSEYANIDSNPQVMTKVSSDGKTIYWYADRNESSASIFSDDLLQTMQLSRSGMVSYFLAIE